MATKESNPPRPRATKVDGGPISVESTKHSDRRVNIPTADLAARLSETEKNPPTLLYPRDPSLDPQLVWKGKDEQDSNDFAVPVVPIYIQEKIDPRIIVENLRNTAKDGGAEPELRLFDDFDGLEGTQMLEFYEHEGNWSNRMILGDSLLVMNSLAEMERLKGKVQMIYIDPPYGIDFRSNWQTSTRRRNVKDGEIADITRQPEQVKAFRDTWSLGVNSYLSYLRDRLVVARDLLTQTGSIFMQIGDQNEHLVRSVLEEVFGPDNFLSIITFRKTSPLGSSGLAGVSDFILWYAKDAEQVKRRSVYKGKTSGMDSMYQYVELEDGTRRRMSADERRDPLLLPLGARQYRIDKLVSTGYTESCYYDFEYDGKTYKAQAKSWITNQQGMKRLMSAGRVTSGKSVPSYVRYLDDFGVQSLTNIWDDTAGATDLVYVVQTSTKVVERCMMMATDPGDLVLDPTCGSGTTAYVAEQWGRRWITTDTSRVALALARTRLMSSKFSYYLLEDSKEGSEKEAALGGGQVQVASFGSDIRKGFVYRRVPHITLKSIANNEKIVEGINRKEVRKVIEQSAEQELLLDQPYEDRRKVRVSGRFTVESLSPHRTLDGLDTGVTTTTGGFTERILGHLRKAGVQNTYKGERLEFSRLDTYPGTWLNGEGEYSEKDGTTKRVAVAVGPEHGTVSADMIRESAIEASDGRGFDVLIVCGLAFDPYAGEQAKKFGRLVVLPTKINPDLTMPNGLLKNTGSGNLFTVFGEPDIEIKRDEDGNVVVRIEGVDVYDPTTGVVRSGSPEDIACWFIDTNYDQKSFFVRHAYFTGGNEPYESLAKTLRAEINEDAWASLYSTESRPFDPPESGRIAVKVINHFGDEVMQVYVIPHS